eukprot:Cvel_33822.t1-p1 / transcript=Cvel_33822.t1 / gene=Cvel_33822 / organism=Chromera_velia_CCMP2878 / gene_product=hypothetical protein / transcript_product=hypothetical protein / location=Cvel_scaffold5610:524-4845(+) / protein_length=950 / sequence_SO=supercontig / SO=protein_coding / is_pseudo=false
MKKVPRDVLRDLAFQCLGSVGALALHVTHLLVKLFLLFKFFWEVWRSGYGPDLLLGDDLFGQISVAPPPALFLGRSGNVSPSSSSPHTASSAFESAHSPLRLHNRKDFPLGEKIEGMDSLESLRRSLGDGTSPLEDLRRSLRLLDFQGDTDMDKLTFSDGSTANMERISPLPPPFESARRQHHGLSSPTRPSVSPPPSPPLNTGSNQEPSLAVSENAHPAEGGGDGTGETSPAASVTQTEEQPDSSSLSFALSLADAEHRVAAELLAELDGIERLLESMWSGTASSSPSDPPSASSPPLSASVFVLPQQTETGAVTATETETGSPSDSAPSGAVQGNAPEGGTIVPSESSVSELNPKLLSATDDIERSDANMEGKGEEGGDKVNVSERKAESEGDGANVSLPEGVHSQGSAPETSGSSPPSVPASRKGIEMSQQKASEGGKMGSGHVGAGADKVAIPFTVSLGILVGRQLRVLRGVALMAVLSLLRMMSPVLPGLGERAGSAVMDFVGLSPSSSSPPSVPDVKGETAVTTEGRFSKWLGGTGGEEDESTGREGGAVQDGSEGGIRERILAAWDTVSSFVMSSTFGIFGVVGHEVMGTLVGAKRRRAAERAAELARRLDEIDEAIDEIRGGSSPDVNKVSGLLKNSERLKAREREGRWGVSRRRSSILLEEVLREREKRYGLGEGGEGRSRDHAERERERERLWSKHPSGVSRRWSRVYVRFQNAQWIFCVMNLWIFLHFYESFWGPLTRARRRLNALASRVGLGGATLRGVLQIVQLNPPVLSKIRLLLSLLASQLGSWHAGKRAVEVFLYSVCTSYVDVGMQFCLDFAGFFLWLHALLSRLEAIKRRGRRVFVLAAGELVILPRNPTPVNQKEQGGQENLGSDSERRQLELGVRTEGEAGVERETETRTQPVSSSSARQETGNGGEELSHSSSSSSSSSASSSHSPPSV